MISRRILLGGGLAALATPAAAAAGPVEIAMRGTARDESVWFLPQGLAVPAGTTLRFVNRDPGNGRVVEALRGSERR